MHHFKSVTGEQKDLTKRWWDAFANKQEEIETLFTPEGLENIVQFMQNNLQIICPGSLFWEFGPGFTKPHRLVITCEGRRELRPLIHYILQQAPELDHFEFYQYRLPETIEQLPHHLQSRTGWSCDLDKIKFSVSPGQFNKIDITFFTSLPDEEQEQFWKLLVLTEILLGEEELDKWVGAIEIKPMPVEQFAEGENTQDLTSMEGLLPVESLCEIFKQLRDDIRAELPEMPYHHFFDADTTEWRGFEIDREELENYEFKDDVIVGVAISTGVMEATFNDRDFFASERFSNHNETFIYIKIDRGADDMDIDLGEVENRNHIEDTLNQALQGIGCTIGGGTGFRYSYIDLAVTDLEQSVQIITSLLQQMQLTRQSWILFHDADYHVEWIGIWPDSPAPYKAVPVLH